MIPSAKVVPIRHQLYLLSHFLICTIIGVTLVTCSDSGTGPDEELPDVQDGVVGPEGGILTAIDGAVRIEVPAGTLAEPTELTVSRNQAPPDAPDGYWIVGGQSYELGPEGITFEKPVTVSIIFDIGEFPVWMRLSTLSMHRWDGNNWHPLEPLEEINPLDRITGGPGSQIVSARTTGFSTFSATSELPEVRITPDPANISSHQRSVILKANVDTDGEIPDDSEIFHYEWSTAGMNGTISPGDDIALPVEQAQYIATIPVLPDFDPIDEVFVSVEANIMGATVPIGTASAEINGDLEYVYRLEPDFSEVEPEESVPMRAIIIDEHGNEVTEKRSTTEDIFLEYDWSETGLHGSIFVDDPIPITPTVKYYAKSEEEITAEPPRIDKITVNMKIRIEKYDEARTPLETLEFEGSAEAFVEVTNKEYDVRLTPREKAIPKGATATFTTRIEPEYEGKSLFYRFLSSENHGSLSSLSTNFIGSNRITYNADGDSHGEDWIEVRVYDDLLHPIGSARATVKVTEKKVETGTWFSYETYEVPSSDPAWCHSYAFIEWFHVEGAERYELSWKDDVFGDSERTSTGDHSEVLLTATNVLYRRGDHYETLSGYFSACEHHSTDWGDRFSEPKAEAVF